MQKPRNIDGFTMVEMLVVAGVVAVLAIGFSAYLYQQSRSVKFADNKNSVQKLQADVLIASGSADQITSTEELQYNDLGGPKLTCESPCQKQMYNGALQCVYDHSWFSHLNNQDTNSNASYGTCPSLPENCINIGGGC